MGWSNSLGQTWKTTNSCFKAYSRLDLWYSCAWKTCFLGLRFWLVLSDGYHWVFCPEKSEKWDDHPDAQHWLLNTDSRSEHPGVGPSLFNADEVMLFLHFTMWTRFFIPQLSAGCGCLVKSFSVWKLSFQLCLDGFVHGFVQFCHQSLTCFVQFGASNLRKAVFGTAGSIKSWTTAGWMLLLDQTMHQNLKLKQIKPCLRIVQVPPFVVGIDGHWWALLSGFSVTEWTTFAAAFCKLLPTFKKRKGILHVFWKVEVAVQVFRISYLRMMLIFEPDEVGVMVRFRGTCTRTHAHFVLRLGWTSDGVGWACWNDLNDERVGWETFAMAKF